MMKIQATAWFTLAVLVLGLLVACGDDDGVAATPTTAPETPAGSSPTATTPAETPTPAPPAAADPALQADATFVTDGTIDSTVEPGGSLDLDPVELAVADVGAAPPCAGLVGQWTWAAVSGGPGADPAALRVVGMRQGGEFEIGSGAEGSANSGCFLAQFKNESDGPVQVQVRYVIGSLE